MTFWQYADHHPVAATILGVVAVLGVVAIGWAFALAYSERPRR